MERIIVLSSTVPPLARIIFLLFRIYIYLFIISLLVFFSPFAFVGVLTVRLDSTNEVIRVACADVRFPLEHEEGTDRTGLRWKISDFGIPGDALEVHEALVRGAIEPWRRSVYTAVRERERE